MKRQDLTECYLTDDAIMKLLVNRRERTISGVNISRFNETEFIKGGFLRSRHKGKGAPALAPDGTVMTVTTGAHHNGTVVLHGGNPNLPVGSWSVENYQARSDQPGYYAWLSKIKWTGDDALRGGIPLTAINATVTSLPKRAQQTFSEPKENTDDIREEKADSPHPQLNNADDLTKQGQPSNAGDLANQGQQHMTGTHPVTQPQAVPEETPSEYATLSSAYSEITTSSPATPEPSRLGAGHSAVTALELTAIKPVNSEPVALEPTISEPVTSGLAAAEPATSKPIISEAAISDRSASEPANLEPVVPKPVVSGRAASQPVTSEPTASDPAVSEPISSEPAAVESATSELATGSEVSAAPLPVALDPAASEFTISEPATSKTSASAPAATEPTTSELNASKRSASEPAPVESFSSVSIQANITPPVAAESTIAQGQPSTSVRQQSAPPGPTSIISLAPDMKFEAKICTVGSEATVGLGIDTGLIEPL